VKNLGEVSDDNHIEFFLTQFSPKDDWVLRVEKEGKKEGSIQSAPEWGVKCTDHFSVFP